MFKKLAISVDNNVRSWYKADCKIRYSSGPKKCQTRSELIHLNSISSLDYSSTSSKIEWLLCCLFMTLLVKEEDSFSSSSYSSF